MNRFWTFIVGGAFLGFGIYEAEHTISLKLSGAEATGTVVAADVKRKSSYPWKSDSLAPVVEFQTPDGRWHGFVSKLSSTTFGYALGEKVPVLYDAADPDRNARIDGFFVNWFGALIGLGVGGYALLWFFGVVKTKDGESPLRSRRSRWWGEDD